MFTDLRVVEIIKEADGIVSILLERPDGSLLPEWQPGSHIDLRLPNGIVRQYSLSGDPCDRLVWRISVKREDSGRGGSAFVHDRLRVGDKLQAGNPRNNFKLVDASDYIFIAGGIGVTPLLPMIRATRDQGKPWKLHYCGRSRSTMAFLEELSAYGDSVQYFPSDEGARIDIREVLAEPARQRVVYCCGPERLMRAVEQSFVSWPRNNLHLERFKVQERPKTNDKEFEIFCSTSNIRIKVAPGQSILDALEGAGVSPPHTCRDGVCGSCETQIIEGVAEHRDSVLTAEERSANESLMICVSRSRTAVLVLDL
jgi:ferredoxin-NADP reductase